MGTAVCNWFICTPFVGSMQVSNGAGPTQVVQQVIDSQVDELLGSQSIQQYCEEYISSHGTTSLRHTAAAAEMLLLMQPHEKQRAVKLLMDTQTVSEQPGKSCCPCISLHAGW